MLERATREWPIDKRESFLIGDKDDDLAAAAAFNVRGIKFYPRVHSLPDLVRRQLATKSGPQGRSHQ
jgi:D-glycero-D-manno-heptose 1,7-bisphosphate phosphatase